MTSFRFEALKAASNRKPVTVPELGKKSDIFGSNVFNATRLFIGEDGARCTNNVNEIVHYEFGAALASDCILKAMNHLDVGVSEKRDYDLTIR